MLEGMLTALAIVALVWALLMFIAWAHDAWRGADTDWDHHD